MSTGSQQPANPLCPQRSPHQLLQAQTRRESQLGPSGWTSGSAAIYKGCSSQCRPSCTLPDQCTQLWLLLSDPAAWTNSMSLLAETPAGQKRQMWVSAGQPCCTGYCLRLTTLANEATDLPVPIFLTAARCSRQSQSLSVIQWGHWKLLPRTQEKGNACQAVTGQGSNMHSWRGQLLLEGTRRKQGIAQNPDPDIHEVTQP